MPKKTIALWAPITTFGENWVSEYRISLSTTIGSPFFYCFLFTILFYFTFCSISFLFHSLTWLIDWGEEIDCSFLLCSHSHTCVRMLRKKNSYFFIWQQISIKKEVGYINTNSIHTHFFVPGLTSMLKEFCESQWTRIYIYLTKRNFFIIHQNTSQEVTCDIGNVFRNQFFQHFLHTTCRKELSVCLL